jgi:hypothetical protein
VQRNMRDYADCEMYTHEPQVTSAAPAWAEFNPSLTQAPSTALGPSDVHVACKCKRAAYSFAITISVTTFSSRPIATVLEVVGVLEGRQVRGDAHWQAGDSIAYKVMELESFTPVVSSWKVCSLAYFLPPSCRAVRCRAVVSASRGCRRQR